VNSAQASDHSQLGARAVVCSGKVYVGDLGAKHRSNFTIIGPAVNETFRLEKVPDLYGLSLLIASSTADMIMQRTNTGVLGSNVLLRIDDIDLKGFAGPRSIYALVPEEDPGLAEFEAARAALDRGMLQVGLARLGAVASGMLQQAAKVLSARYQAPRAADVTRLVI
jgi:class 3 adenylate cyclase